MTLELRLGGRRAGSRTITFDAAGKKTVRIRLSRWARLALVRQSRRRLLLTGVVRDPDGGAATQFRALPR